MIPLTLKSTTEDLLFFDYSVDEELSIEIRIAYQELTEEIRLILFHEEYNSYIRKAFPVTSIEEFNVYVSAMGLILDQFPDGVYFGIEYPEIHIDEKGNRTVKSFSIGNLYIERESVASPISWRDAFITEEEVGSSISDGEITNAIDLKETVSTSLDGVTEIEEAVKLMNKIIARATFLNTSISFSPEESVPLVVARYIFGFSFVNFICDKYRDKVLIDKGKGKITVRTRNLLELYIKNKSN